MRVSVIIPTYNRAGTIADAVASVLEQTVQPHEVIVVDDGSTDETPSVLARFGNRITVIPQPNGGVSSARNTGIARATGDWLAFLDSDDVWLPDRLAVLHRDVDPERDGLHAADLVLAGPGYEERLFPLRGLELLPGTATRMDRALRYVISGLSLDSIACRRDWMLVSGGFDPALRMFEDLDVLARLALCGPWVFAGDVVCRAQRISEDPRLALTAAADRNRIQTRRALVRIFERLLASERLCTADRLLVRRAVSGALLAVADCHFAAGSAREALSSLARSVTLHPSPVKGAAKAAATLLLGPKGRAALSRSDRGFHREDAEKPA